MEIAAGEYGYTPWYFQQMLAAQAVDCLQADATRCGGFTGFRKVSALCEAYQIPLSAHCAPQLHAHLGCCSQPLRHIEYFHDHVRISKMLFDGALVAEEGQLRPNPARPGHGLTLKHPEAEKYKISDAGYVCE
jgi:L-alanine-DL-glutamate epimerase-like enolase superfamily enzyme